jgi:hypothetical protein
MKILSRKTASLALALFIAAIVCLAYSYFVEPNLLVIKEKEIRIKGWDPAFDGLRIAMISDVRNPTSWFCSATMFRRHVRVSRSTTVR